MKQVALDLNLNLKKKRKREFLEQMERVVPWAALVMLIAPYYPEGRTGRPPFALDTMLCTHFLQQWFSLSDPAMEEAFFDVPVYREFARLDTHGRLPDVEHHFAVSSPAGETQTGRWHLGDGQ